MLERRDNHRSALGHDSALASLELNKLERTTLVTVAGGQVHQLGKKPDPALTGSAAGGFQTCSEAIDASSLKRRIDKNKTKFN